MSEKASRQALYYLGMAAAVLMWLAVYAIPRLHSVHELETESQGYVRQRQEIANSLAALTRSRRDLPDPAPNTVSWLAAHALTGLEKHLEINNPYGNGIGSQLKLRNINNAQIVRLLKALGEVNLIIKSFKAEDADGNGRWNLEMMVEVPK